MPKTDPIAYAAKKYYTIRSGGCHSEIDNFSDFSILSGSLCAATMLLVGDPDAPYNDHRNPRCEGKCSTNIDKVAIFIDGHSRKFQQNPSLKDRAVSFTGLNNAIPFLFSPPLGAPGGGGGWTECCKASDAGYGITKFEAGNTDTFYAVISSRKNEYNHSYIVILRKDINTVLNHFDAQNEKNENILLIDRPPILNSEFMKEVLKNSVEFLENHDNFAHFGTRPARGLIFRGDPGNGKTMLCKWIHVLAKKAGLSVKSYSGSDIDLFYRDGEMPYMMNSANIMFFDDIDISFLTRRKGAESDSKKACALLSAMDGISDVKKGVVRIFTTNEKTMDIDPAFLRPGRIDRAFNFESPTDDLRSLVINTYWHPDILKEINVNDLVKETNGISFADLEEIKTLLVQGFIFNKKWDLNIAINDFRCRKDTNKEELEALN